MKNHLIYIAEEYNQKPDVRGVRPIALSDCQIITELIAILNKKSEVDLANVLDKWKDLDDQRVLDKLIEYSETVEVLDDEENPKTIFLQVKDQIFQPEDIFRIEPIERFDERMIYSIRLNKLEEGLTLKGVRFVDVIIDYYSIEQRDGELHTLKKKMSDYKNCTFL
jgi:hypothetical protein